METIKPKTEPWTLESLNVRQTNHEDPENWEIKAGGAQQPEYRISATDIDSAVNELVRQVTRDAIEDEAREWQEPSNKNEARLKWLHDCSTGQTDPDGYEWGIYRVKWENGKAVSVMQTNSDFSDLDAEMERELNVQNTERSAASSAP